MRMWALGIGLIIAVIAGLASLSPDRTAPTPSRSAEVLEGCAREYGTGTDEQRQCATRIMFREHQERQAAADKRAAR